MQISAFDSHSQTIENSTIATLAGWCESVRVCGRREAVQKPSRTTPRDGSQRAAMCKTSSL
ncbi:hypothetical protein PVAG01_00086 [Phlyctema vagabunda]|uniref:Uncharacterized protein n=1 Tax=Phlyctema vagabunda TaxID=108571 RepID=A0ABR4PTV0_9HELO